MALTGLSDNELRWITRLKELGQEHLLIEGASETDTRRLLQQIERADSLYPGGLAKYLEKAKSLLAAARDGVNPMEGYTPEEPEGEKLVVGGPNYCELERIGAQNIALTCFALVAGGMGERLGYPDIKVALPVEISTMTSHIELYAKHILSYEDYASVQLQRTVTLPLVIMTSDDTHEKTLSFLKQNDYFGLLPSQVAVLKQEKVLSVIDNEARIGVTPEDPFTLDTKPHGHGDIHMLLMQAGLPQKWTEQGYKWLVFFQDTNSLVFRSLLAVLGVSARKNFVMNSITVPRKPGEAVGSICRLRRQDGSALTVNVEYNHLESLLKASNGQGDVPNADGYSAYPGNINVFVVNIPRYTEALRESGGVVSEFVNPKYTDSSKTAFKSATRLECMMQDLPNLLHSSDSVGFTEMERWVCFSAVKNNKTDGAAKARASLPSETAFSGESDYYAVCARLLRMAAERAGACIVDIPQPVPATYHSVKYQLGPRVVLMPSFAISFDDLVSKLCTCQGYPLVMTADSTLVLEGDVAIRGLTLKGTLVARASIGSKLRMENLSVNNKGWEICELSDEESAEPRVAVRGYQLIRHDQTELEGSSSQ